MTEYNYAKPFGETYATIKTLNGNEFEEKKEILHCEWASVS